MSKLLSIIIPVYNTEQYVNKALDSVLKNTYSNVEIIVVNDGSQGNFEEVASTYAGNPKIKFISHKKNRGLFRARLTGFEHSKGEYIAFLDSDDFVSVDWYRSLIFKLESENADMSIGDFNLHYQDKDTFYPRSILRKSTINLVGREVQDTFFRQAGIDYSWHVVWNKVYTRSLMEQVSKLLDPIEDHIVMCEDVLYSCAFYMLANKVVNSHYNYYYYNKNVNSSTSDNINIIKHTDTIIRVFKNIRKVLSSKDYMNEYSHCIDQWEDRLLFAWKNKCSNNTDYISYIESNMHNKNFSPDVRKEHYYYKEEIMHRYAYENIKKQIIECDVISFDVFDTLLLRPFLAPTDLFSILEAHVNTRLQSIDSIHFKIIRIEAEKYARQHCRLFNKNNQEVTLNDIYERIASITCLNKEILDEIKAKEIELELKYLTKRNSGYELYSMARHLGKKIIITSDMYLSKDIIQQALKKMAIQI